MGGNIFDGSGGKMLGIVFMLFCINLMLFAIVRSLDRMCNLTEKDDNRGIK